MPKALSVPMTAAMRLLAQGPMVTNKVGLELRRANVVSPGVVSKKAGSIMSALWRRGLVDQRVVEAAWFSTREWSLTDAGREELDRVGRAAHPVAGGS